MDVVLKIIKYLIEHRNQGTSLTDHPNRGTVIELLESPDFSFYTEQTNTLTKTNHCMEKKDKECIIGITFIRPYCMQSFTLVL